MRKGHLAYLRRIIPAYVLKKNSQLTFWHGQPQVNAGAFANSNRGVSQYYMVFHQKASYPGPFGENRIPLLNYHGRIGKQYNPIAIAQYGLGNYNLYKKTQTDNHFDKFKKVADWLVENLEKNKFGIYVWSHNFDWEYYQTLKAPWYSALAQGQGISVLTRAYLETTEDKYIQTTQKAFEALTTEVKNGGVLFIDECGNPWLEEYLVEPPSHVLNGFIWALWGLRDYFLATNDASAERLYQNCIKTIEQNLHRYDNGYWSLYDLSENKLRTIASPFYHSLHIVQLDIMHRLTSSDMFQKYSEKWQGYADRKINALRAMCYKAVFKLLYY